MIGAQADPTGEVTAPAPGPPAAAASPAAGEGPAVFDDQAPSTNGDAANGNGRRRSMSSRLGDVPDADRDERGPVVVNARGTAVTAPVAEPTEETVLVPEVMAPGAPVARTAPVAPVIPTIVPAQPDVIAPPPTVTTPTTESEPGLYDLADDDPALVLQPPVRVRRRRPRVRRVTRVVRTIDTWSVFKVAVLFAAVLYVSALLSGVLLWNVAYATGTIDNAERFMESFGWQTFEFHGGEVFHDAWIIGMFAAAGLVGLAVLAAATFNLVSDLVGGVRVTVLEEEMVVRPVTRRRKQRIRKAPPRAATAAPPAAGPTAGIAEPGQGLAVPKR